MRIFFSLAVHHLTIFNLLIQRDFLFFRKIKVSNQLRIQRFSGQIITCKKAGLRVAVTHTVASYQNSDGL